MHRFRFNIGDIVSIFTPHGSLAGRVVSRALLPLRKARKLPFNLPRVARGAGGRKPQMIEPDIEREIYQLKTQHPSGLPSHVTAPVSALHLLRPFAIIEKPVTEGFSHG